MNIKQTSIFFLSFFCFAAVFFASSLAVKENREDLGANYSLQINPLPGKIIPLLAGEFKGLLADHILLEIGAFVGSNKKISADEEQKIYLGMEQAMILDPYFMQTYLFTQALLSWDCKMPEEAIRLLEISRKHLPWDWRPGYYIGFDYYYFLNDYAKASEIFLETAKIKNSPLLIALLGSRFALKSKKNETAILLLTDILKDPELSENNRESISKRITALKGVLLIESALRSYKKTFNTYPSSLNALVQKGFLKKLPPNSYYKTYLYRQEDGQVFFDKTGYKQISDQGTSINK